MRKEMLWNSEYRIGPKATSLRSVEASKCKIRLH
jgi:hypothetical protein